MLRAVRVALVAAEQERDRLRLDDARATAQQLVSDACAMLDMRIGELEHELREARRVCGNAADRLDVTGTSEVDRAVIASLRAEAGKATP